MSETKYSPMITQYLKVKEKYPDTKKYRIDDSKFQDDSSGFI